ncbi:exonuclease domain-containing protein [Alphaproteobacteria bacterium]|nr:exonuclease domain-containing protein [Alphaproteobacteria bacterium]
MTGKYIFYDLETTGRGKKESSTAFGTTPKWEQILQIAAIVTDENFQPTNQNMNIFCRPRMSIIAQPGALITTERGIKESLHAELSSYELIKQINSTLDVWKKDNPDCIFIGHNSINFDETVLEYNLFSNLFYPYPTRSKRGDTLNLVRGLYASNPSLIKTDLTARGNPSFKLEKLAELNGLPVEFSHDAFSDVKTSIALAKFVKDSDKKIWSSLCLTMDKKQVANYINNNSGITYLTSFGGRVALEALSMVCESQMYKGMYHTLKLSTDPTPLLEANNAEFKILLSKKPSKNRWLTTADHPIFLDNSNAINYKPYSEIGSEVLNERKKLIFKNKSLADKFKMYEIDRQLEKEENASQDNIFPESKANVFFDFKEQSLFKNFHVESDWKEKYKIALTVKDPNASFILKRLIFDECPEILLENDFKIIHNELHDRLVVNQERPFTTIPEAMKEIDDWKSKEGTTDQQIDILNEYDIYLRFMENYFSSKNSKPLKKGKELSNQIFG